MRASPIAKPLGRIVQAPRGANEVLDRSCREQIARRHALVDTQVFGTAYHASIAQVLDHALVAREPDRRVAGDPADGLFALFVAAAEQQVGDAFLGQYMRHVVPIDHHRWYRHVRALGQRPGIELLDKSRLHVLAERFHDLDDQLAPARHGPLYVTSVSRPACSHAPVA